jgi:hypothetical protein
LRHAVDVGLDGTCRDVLRALAPLIEHKPDRSFLKKAQERMTQWNELMEERGTRTDMPMKPQVITYQLSKLLNDDAIVSAELLPKMFGPELWSRAEFPDDESGFARATLRCVGVGECRRAEGARCAQVTA